MKDPNRLLSSIKRSCKEGRTVLYNSNCSDDKENHPSLLRSEGLKYYKARLSKEFWMSAINAGICHVRII
jgi:hypothetical protein